MPAKRKKKQQPPSDMTSTSKTSTAEEDSGEIQEPKTKKSLVEPQEETSTTRREVGDHNKKSTSTSTAVDLKSKRQLKFTEDSDISRSYWVLKSEPNCRVVKGVDVSYSLSELMSETGQVTYWDGIRNSEANHNIQLMKKGDLAFFYHSNCRDPGLVGLVQIIKTAYPDHTQFDPASPYYDKRSTPDRPIWFMVDIKFVRKLKRPIYLSELKRYYNEHASSDGPLSRLLLVLRTRLSVQPMLNEEYEFIVNNIEPLKAPSD